MIFVLILKIKFYMAHNWVLKVIIIEKDINLSKRTKSSSSNSKGKKQPITIDLVTINVITIIII